MNSQSDNQLRNYTLIYPVYNLKISRDIGCEIQIERVIFASREKIPRIRKRIGIKQKISELNKIWKKHKIPKLFEEAPSFAIIKFKSGPTVPPKIVSVEISIEIIEVIVFVEFLVFTLAVDQEP